MSDEHGPVPEPWSPMVIDREDDLIGVVVSGRQYRFGKGAALPVSITAVGNDLLAEPVRLVGQLYGEPIEWQHQHISLLQHDEASAIFIGAMETTGVIISNSVKIDYDGLVRYDMAITPYLSNFRQGAERAHGLERLWLEIPLRARYASLFTFWPIDYGGVVQTVTATNSGALPAEGVVQPFKPFTWVGWEDGGLSWIAESDRGWQPADPARAIEVIPGGDIVLWRFHFLDSQPASWADTNDSWYRPNAPVTISFALQATPVKPASTDSVKYRMVHLNYYEPWKSSRIEHDSVWDGGTETVLDRVVASGANVVVLHEAWNSIQNHWINDRPAEIKATVAACHAHGLKIIPYFGYELSTLAPEWAEMHERVLIKDSDGRFQGGWQRLPSQRDYMVCYASEWQVRWLNGIAWMLDEYGFDGVYLDGTTMPSACANTAHRCGYRLQNGTLRATYPVYAVRSMLERLYRLVAARGGVITAHQSSCCLTPTLEYCHTYWDGEHIGGIFSRDADGHFPLSTFRAEFMGWNYGIPAEFLSGQPQAIAFSLIHNVLVRPGIGDMLDLVAPIWRALVAFDIGSACWLPYWRGKDYIDVDCPDVYVSAYIREDAVLLAIANLNAEKHADAAVVLCPQRVGHHKYGSALDALTGDPCRVTDNGISITCQAMEWRLIEVHV